jgi:hypothetical protein
MQNIQNKYVALTVKLYKPIHTQQDANLKDKDNMKYVTEISRYIKDVIYL